jgi:hypothetical protein
VPWIPPNCYKDIRLIWLVHHEYGVVFSSFHHGFFSNDFFFILPSPVVLAHWEVSSKFW